MSDFNIRSYHSSDNDQVYNICLQTGDSGKDATKLFNDPLVLGHIYAGPYMEYEPQSVFILNDDSGICGYILGTMNSNAFYDWMNKDWFPVIRKDYNQPIGESSTWSRTEKTINILFQPMNNKLFTDFPAHLHIDLLPRAQGKGQGTLMMDHYILHLKKNNISGVHLELGITNERAFNFYSKYGMDELERDDDSIYMGLYI
jgi:GNAT superfamily N-acetyltransferase